MRLKEALHQLVERVNEQIEVLYEVGKNPDTPLLAKIIVLVALAYALSPIDIIPDFIAEYSIGDIISVFSYIPNFGALSP